MGLRNLDFLGFEASSKALSPLPTNVAAIGAFEFSRTKRQLKSCLGVYQFFAHFVSNHAGFLQPLLALTTDNEPNRDLLWNKTFIAFFEQNKKALADATSLAFAGSETRNFLRTRVEHLSVAFSSNWKVEK